MTTDVLHVALVHETFHGADGSERLAARLGQARQRGADLAVLPELPLNAWAPASRGARDEDAEAADGPRQRALSDAARRAGVGVLGGAIVRDGRGGRRVSQALLWDAGGRLVATYAKLHIPHEQGFWESDHYEAGDDPPRRIDAFALPLGIQICSDLNRPQGCLMLGAQGACAVLAPRATPLETYERWRLVLRADALTSAVYIVSVNRPGPESGVGIGGPSLVVAPDGQVVHESTDAVSVVALRREAVDASRRAYPGYLAVRSELYARGWSETARGR